MLKNDRFACRLMAACVAMLAAAYSSAPQAAASLPSTSAPPTISLPPSGQHGFPFLSTVIDLRAYDYVEEEFFVSGEAQAYVPAAAGDLLADGRWNVVPNAGGTASYTTRLLVRRPRDSARFNGTVVVEWMNESGPTETASDWIYLHQEILDRGYAYVGVSAQYHAIQVLHGWESGAGARYANLSHPGDSFAYSIFAQAGQAVAQPRKDQPLPLGDLTREMHSMLATGFSQSAFWLVTYINAVHRLNPFFDGFLLHDGGVDANLSFSAADDAGDPVPPGVPATPDVVTPYPFQLRSDQHVPVLIMQSEFGLSDYGNGAARSFHEQPDTPSLRIWEFTGAPHIEADYIRDVTAEGDKSQPGQTVVPCDGPPTIPALVHGYGVRAALHALTDWVSQGRLPRSASRMSLTIPRPLDDFDQSVVFNLDPATKLTQGGIRLPAIAVPIATLDGNRSDLDNDAQGPGGQCYFAGAYDPWNHDSDPWDGIPGLDPSFDPEPDLLALYPSHEDYVLDVARSVIDSVEAGHVLPEDAGSIVLQAIAAPVP